MSFFDRVTNPVWADISKLPKDMLLEVCLLITVHPFLRDVIVKGFVDEFLEWLKGMPKYKRRVSAKQHQKLVDEAEFALLCVSRKKPFCPEHFQKTNASEVLDAIGAIALGDAHSRGNETKAQVLANLDYSEDIEEARTQLIFGWMRILGIKEPEFVQIATMGHVELRWKSIVGIFHSASAEGIRRAKSGDRSALIARAKITFSQYPPSVKEIIRYLVSNLQKSKSDSRRSDQPKFETPTPLSSRLVRIVDELSGKCDEFMRGEPSRILGNDVGGNPLQEGMHPIYSYGLVYLVCCQIVPTFRDGPEHRKFRELQRCYFRTTGMDSPEKDPVRAAEILSKLMASGKADPSPKEDSSFEKISQAEDMMNTNLSKESGDPLQGLNMLLMGLFFLGKIPQDYLNRLRDSIQRHTNSLYASTLVRVEEAFTEAGIEVEQTPELESERQKDHELGISVVGNSIKKEGGEILQVNHDPKLFPQMVAEINGDATLIAVKTVRAPNKATLTSPIRAELLSMAENNHMKAAFASVELLATGESNEEGEEGFFVKYTGLKMVSLQTPDG